MAKFPLGLVLAPALCGLFAAAKRGGPPWSAGEVVLFALNAEVLAVAAATGVAGSFGTAIRPWLGRSEAGRWRRLLAAFPIVTPSADKAHLT
ncbi:MAG: hypothetical protein IT318_06840 [Anaerolineales bacterium]|nr:hypothetical protein [Anaerolineales bacterium]